MFLKPKILVIDWLGMVCILWYDKGDQITGKKCVHVASRKINIAINQGIEV